MKILLTGGGTAGHVTPLLAVASEIKSLQPNVRMRYVGKFSDPSSQPVASHFAIEKTYSIFAGKLRRFHGKPWYWYVSQPSLLLHNVKDALQFAIGYMQSLVLLAMWRPDVVFVKGGYVGLPVGLAAALLRIPIITHDSDVVPGLTNRVLARYAQTVAVGAPIEQYPQYAHKNVVYTGVPVRPEFLHARTIESAKAELQIPPSSEVIVITGGSLGAVRLNTAVLANVDTLMADSRREVYWLTGAYGYKSIRTAIQHKAYKQRIHLEKYSDNVPALFSAASVIISRAGATTLAEIAALAKPAIIIPNPLLTGGHQVKNGDMYHRYNAATVISEQQLREQPSSLITAIHVLMNDESLRAAYQRNLSALAAPNAALTLAQIIIKEAKK